MDKRGTNLKVTDGNRNCEGENGGRGGIKSVGEELV